MRPIISFQAARTSGGRSSTSLITLAPSPSPTTASNASRVTSGRISSSSIPAARSGSISQ
jgi:hypothetical protein